MKLLFIGDSLVEYFDWQGRFPEHLAYNMGVAGETVEGLYARLPVILEQVEGPDAVFIMSGINNMAMGDRSFAAAYRKIIERLKRQYPSSRVFVQSLLPVLFPSITNDEIREINVELKKIAEEENVEYLDIHRMFLDEAGGPVRNFLMEDGVHVSASGYSVWSGVIEALLKKGPDII